MTCTNPLIKEPDMQIHSPSTKTDKPIYPANWTIQQQTLLLKNQTCRFTHPALKPTNPFIQQTEQSNSMTQPAIPVISVQQDTSGYKAHPSKVGSKVRNQPLRVYIHLYLTCIRFKCLWNCQWTKPDAHMHPTQMKELSRHDSRTWQCCQMCSIIPAPISGIMPSVNYLENITHQFAILCNFCFSLDGDRFGLSLLRKSMCKMLPIMRCKGQIWGRKKCHPIVWKLQYTQTHSSWISHKPTHPPIWFIHHLHRNLLTHQSSNNYTQTHSLTYHCIRHMIQTPFQWESATHINPSVGINIPKSEEKQNKNIHH